MTSVQKSHDSYSSCPECGGHINIDDARAETTCINCGLVLAQRQMDLEGMPRSYDHIQKANKLTRSDFCDYVMYKMLTATTIRKDELEKLPKRSDLKRAAKWNSRTLSSQERREYYLNTLLHNAFDLLDLPRQLRRNCFYLLKKLLDKTPIMGRSYAGFVGWIIHQICKEAQYPIEMIRIAEACNCPRAERDILLFRKVIPEVPEIKDVSHIAPDAYIPKFCNMLKLTQETQNRAIKIFKALPSLFTSGKKPSVMAGAIIHLLTRGVIKQRTLAKTMGCSEVSIRYTSTDIITILEKKKIYIKKSRNVKVKEDKGSDTPY